MNDTEAQAAATVIGLCERRAEHYVTDRTSVACDESIWMDRFLAEVPSPYRVLDLGCGAGAPIDE